VTLTTGKFRARATAHRSWPCGWASDWLLARSKWIIWFIVRTSRIRSSASKNLLARGFWPSRSRLPARRRRRKDCLQCSPEPKT